MGVKFQKVSVFSIISQSMASLAITIRPKTRKRQRFVVELDVNRLERLAAGLGFFSYEFLKSLTRAESDYRGGRIRRIKSLAQLRNN